MRVGDLVKVAHGSGSGIVGVIAMILRLPSTTLIRLHTGKHFAIDRLEVISENR